MATTVDELLVKITADNKELKRKLHESTQHTKKFGKESSKSLKGFEGAVASAGKAVKVFAVAVITGALMGAFRSLNNLTDKTMKSMDTIAKVADKLGLTTDALQEYHFAAELAGVSTETFDMAFQRFTRRVADARAGLGELLPVLEELDLSLKDEKGNLRSNVEMFELFADKMADIEEPATRIRMSFKAFDSEGVKVLMMLRDGSDGLKAYAREARALGIIIDEDLIRKGEKYTNILTKLERRNAAVAATTAVAWMPVKEMWDNLKLSVGEYISTLLEAGKAADDASMKELERRRVVLEEKVSKKRFFSSNTADKKALDLLNRTIKKREILIAFDKEQVRISKEKADKEGAAIQKLADAKKAAAQTAEEMAKRGIETTRAAMTEDELWTERLAELQMQLDSNTITQETYNRTIAAHNKEVETAAKKADDLVSKTNAFGEQVKNLKTPLQQMASDWMDISKQVESSMVSWMNEGEEALTSFVKTGKLDFKSLADSIIEDLIRIQIRQAMMAVVGGGSSGSSGGGLLGSLATALIGAYTGTTSTAATYNTTAGSQQSQMLAAQDFDFRAGGGRVSPGQPYRIDELRGETFIPDTHGTIDNNPSRHSGMGTNIPVELNITNTGTAQQTTSTTSTWSGQKLVVDVVTKDLNSGGSISQSIRRNFDVRKK